MTRTTMTWTLNSIVCSRPIRARSGQVKAFGVSPVVAGLVPATPLCASMFGVVGTSPVTTPAVIHRARNPLEVR